MGRIACFLALSGILVAAPRAASAKTDLFAEGLVGVSIALSSGSYTEDHEAPAVHTGVRGGVWFSPGKIESRSSGRGRRLGLELQLDRASYGASYYYYQDVMVPGGMTTVRVDPEYTRSRVLGGARVAMPMHQIADLVLRGVGGIDRVTGSGEEIAPMLEFGAQLSFHFGAVRAGLEGAFAVAFHDFEQVGTQGIGPQFGHRPGYGQAVDWIGCLTIGAVF